MYCENCGRKKEHRTKCHHCGVPYNGKAKSKSKFIWIALALLAVLATVYLFLGTDLLNPKEQVAVDS